MSDHKIIEEIKSYAAEPRDIDDIARGFAMLDDFQRTEALNKTLAWLDEDASDREKSQLMDLARKMQAVHSNLRRVGR